MCLTNVMRGKNEEAFYYFCLLVRCGPHFINWILNTHTQSKDKFHMMHTKVDAYKDEFYMMHTKVDAYKDEFYMMHTKVDVYKDEFYLMHTKGDVYKDKFFKRDANYRRG